MRRYNVSIDSPSPLLSFTPANQWRPMKPVDDSLSGKYANGSTAAVTGFAGTGAQFSFSFYGTGFWMYGAKRGNHGFYNVTLDSNPTQSFFGQGAPEQFLTLLYAAPDLKLGQHTVSVVNAGPMGSGNNGLVWFDVDWITYEQQFASPSSSSGSKPSQAVVETTYDVDRGISYLPADTSWGESTFQDSNTGASQTTRTTTTDGASATLNFTLPADIGSGAVGLFGSMDQTHGNYIISLNEISPNSTSLAQNQGYSATYGFNLIHDQMLYYNNRLSPGASYSLRVTNAPGTSPNNLFGLEYIKTWTVGNGTVEGIQKFSSHKSSTGAGAIVGAAFAGLVGFCLVAALCVFLWRRRRKQWLSPIAGPGYYTQKATSNPFIIDGEPGPPPSLARQASAQYSYQSDNAAPSAYPLPAIQTTNLGASPSSSYPGNQFPYIPSFPSPTGQTESARSATSVAPSSVYGGYTSASSSAPSAMSPESALSPSASERTGATGPVAAVRTVAGISAYPRDARLKAQGYTRAGSSDAGPRIPPSQPQPQTQVDYNRQSRPLPAPTSRFDNETASTFSTVRYESDAGPLASSSPPPNEVVLPPEYEDARQPWERRRE